MHEPIAFTLSQLSSTIVNICGLMISVNAAVSIVVKVMNFLGKPEKKQNDNIAELTSRVHLIEEDQKLINQYITSDSTRIKAIEEGNRITQRALLELLSSALNDSNGESLEQTRRDLQNYLINR